MTEVTSRPVLAVFAYRCPSCGRYLMYAEYEDQPQAPDFESLMTCGRCQRWWRIQAVRADAIEVGLQSETAVAHT